MGEGINLAVKNVESESLVVFYLLSVYYCFDLGYPALYGLLYVVDQLCFQVKVDVMEIKAKKKKKGKGVPASWTKFLKLFNGFLKKKGKGNVQEDCEDEELNNTDSQFDSSFLESQF